MRSHGKALPDAQWAGRAAPPRATRGSRRSAQRSQRVAEHDAAAPRRPKVALPAWPPLRRTVAAASAASPVLGSAVLYSESWATRRVQVALAPRSPHGPAQPPRQAPFTVAQVTVAGYRCRRPSLATGRGLMSLALGRAQSFRTRGHRAVIARLGYLVLGTIAVANVTVCRARRLGMAEAGAV